MCLTICNSPKSRMHVLWVCVIRPFILYNVPVLGSDGERQKAEAEDCA